MFIYFHIFFFLFSLLRRQTHNRSDISKNKNRLSALNIDLT